ncbi:MAG: polyprenyl synthetase family protein [Candidatus Eremiobacteraeota bacterium]|nr:polyprenyl synthetase family protein [Candidatus Eremiobacteraeota bacterium]
MIDRSHPPFDEIVDRFVSQELARENVHIAGAVRSMLEAGGKRLRPRIAMLAAPACDPQAEPDPVIASCLELIHVATLIHDDVVDGAQTRRGRASVNRTYGNRFSVLAGDYLFSWVFKKVTQSYANPVPTILAAMLAEICNGEVKQLRATGDLSLGKNRYLEIIGKKTAELFAACAECGAIVALQRKADCVPGQVRELKAVRALRAYGWAFGMAFQIRDDLLDLTADEAALGKPAGSDLRERKVTLPLIYAIEDGDPKLLSLLGPAFEIERDAGFANSALDSLIERIRRSPGVQRSVETMSGFARSAQAALRVLPDTQPREQLAALAGTLVELIR